MGERPDRLELPEHLERTYARAVRLEWVTIAFFVLAITSLALTLGNSQAMKAAWVEDILALAPPIVFLVSSRFRDRPANERFPYGYHRSVSIAFLIAAGTLFAFGLFILQDSVTRLARQERPAIGLVEIMGVQMWLGWPMIVVLVLTMIPAILLGRVKRRLARDLHDKVLYADAEMNRADWLTAGAAALGVLGIGAGLWWADAVAAIIIALDIVRDGARTLRVAAANLMDSRPTKVDSMEPIDLPTRLRAALLEHRSVLDAHVRLREQGHVVGGDALVQLTPATTDVAATMAELTRLARELDWRLLDVVIGIAEPIDERSGPPDVDSTEASVGSRAG